MQKKRENGCFSSALHPVELPNPQSPPSLGFSVKSPGFSRHRVGNCRKSWVFKCLFKNPRLGGGVGDARDLLEDIHSSMSLSCIFTALPFQMGNIWGKGCNLVAVSPSLPSFQALELLSGPLSRIISEKQKCLVNTAIIKCGCHFPAPFLPASPLEPASFPARKPEESFAASLCAPSLRISHLSAGWLRLRRVASPPRCSFISSGACSLL